MLCNMQVIYKMKKQKMKNPKNMIAMGFFGERRLKSIFTAREQKQSALTKVSARFACGGSPHGRSGIIGLGETQEYQRFTGPWQEATYPYLEMQ